MPFSDEVLARLDADAAQIIAKYPRPRSALLPLLHLVQSEEGYVSADGIAYCAAKFGLTEAEVTAVVSFYTMYKRRPVGEYNVGVCTNTLCAIMGGDQIFAELREHLGVGNDETTPDGKVLLEHVECNAACDYAPVVMVNWEFFDNQTPESARQLVDDLRAGNPVSPTRGPGRLCTWREASRILAGFNDDQATDGPSAGPASLVGLKLAKEHGWRAPEPAGARRATADSRADRLPHPHGEAAGRVPGRRHPGPRRPTRRRPGPASSRSRARRRKRASRPGPEVRRQARSRRDRHAHPGPHRELGPAGLLHPGRLQARRRLAGAAEGAGHGRPTTSSRALKNANLRGRGGAGFPTGVKWSFLPQGDGKPHYLVVNADESEPGTCKDVPLMMADPQVLIEGVAITAYAIRAKHAFIYVRGEVLHVVRRLRHAVEEAYAAGYLGQNILGTGFDLDVIVHAGAGAYICGEESALLTSLEGFRGLPRLRPPFPAVAGLYACPTVINNVESIASVPSIVANGADWFAGLGTEKSKGYGIFSLSGHVTTPGQYEAPLGITLRELLDLAGGIRAGHRLKFWTAGRLVHPAADRPAPRRAAGLRVGRRRRVHARHPGAADLRRDHLRGPRGAALDRVLRARVVRQVHAVPGGHVLDGQGAGTARTRPRHRGRPGEAPGHLRQHPRPRVLRPG